MSFPSSIPSNTDPTAINKLSSPSHSALHQSHNAEIVAVETKVGTGASTPTSGKVLRATGTGTSAWGQTVLSTDVATATSADLRGLLSDETGTGVAVFGTAPTLGSPVITTPSIVTSINDSNGNEVIKTPATASAVNEVTITNAATTTSPRISATGGDTNADLLFTGKGSGSARFSGIHDGWVDANETLTYASATTFTCSAALAGVLMTGDRIKLTQTTTKYFYVTSVSGTIITITGGTDYTLANAAITLPFYSKELTPFSFPTYFAYTPTITSVGGTFTSVVGTGSFSMIGTNVFATIVITVTTLGTATGATLATIPVPASSTTSYVGSGRGDVVSGAMYQCRLNSSTQMSIYKYDGTLGQANSEVTRLAINYRAA